MTMNNLMKVSLCVWARDIRAASVRSTPQFESCSPPFSRRYQPRDKKESTPLKSFSANDILGASAVLAFILLLDKGYSLLQSEEMFV